MSHCNVGARRQEGVDLQTNSSMHYFAGDQNPTSTVFALSLY